MTASESILKAAEELATRAVREGYPAEVAKDLANASHALTRAARNAQEVERNSVSRS